MLGKSRVSSCASVVFHVGRWQAVAITVQEVDARQGGRAPAVHCHGDTTPQYRGNAGEEEYVSSIVRHVERLTRHPLSPSHCMMPQGAQSPFRRRHSSPLSGPGKRSEEKAAGSAWHRKGSSAHFHLAAARTSRALHPPLHPCSLRRLLRRAYTARSRTYHRRRIRAASSRAR